MHKFSWWDCFVVVMCGGGIAFAQTPPFVQVPVTPPAPVASPAGTAATAPPAPSGPLVVTIRRISGPDAATPRYDIAAQNQDVAGVLNAVAKESGTTIGLVGR